MQQRFKVTGMTCAACSAGIQKTVNKLAGVKKAEVSLMGQSMTVEYDETAVTAEKIIAAVVSLGYGAALETGEHGAAESAPRKAVNSFGEEAKKRKYAFLFRSGFLSRCSYLTMLHHMAGAAAAVFFGYAPIPRKFCAPAARSYHAHPLYQRRVL